MMRPIRLHLGTFVASFSVTLTLAMHAAALPLIAADYLINVWSSENGLPQNSVNCLAQTPDGYLWVGTRSGGLARFDGDRFVTFNPQTTPELKDVEIETLSVDSRGTLWIAAGNESIASLTHGKFSLVREPNALPRWHPLQIQIVAEDGKSVYLAAYGGAIYRIPRNGGVNEAQRIDLTPPPPDPPTGQFSQAPDGGLWYVTSLQQVARTLFTASKPQFEVFNLGGEANVLAKDNAGKIWVAAGNHLGVITQEGFNDCTPTNGPAFHRICQIIPTRDNSLWIWDGNTLRKMSNGQWILDRAEFSTYSQSAVAFFLGFAWRVVGHPIWRRTLACAPRRRDHPVNTGKRPAKQVHHLLAGG